MSKYLTLKTLSLTEFEYCESVYFYHYPLAGFIKVPVNLVLWVFPPAKHQPTCNKWNDLKME